MQTGKDTTVEEKRGMFYLKGTASSQSQQIPALSKNAGWIQLLLSFKTPFSFVFLPPFLLITLHSGLDDSSSLLGGLSACGSTFMLPPHTPYKSHLEESSYSFVAHKPTTYLVAAQVSSLRFTQQPCRVLYCG